MELRRLSATFRAIRRHRGWRQVDVARRAKVSSSTVSRAETPAVVRLPLLTLERIADALDVRLDLLARWRGGELDRLLNAGHSAMHEQVARMLSTLPGWQFRPEVSFSIYGERGVIDILAFHAASRTLLVIELKTALIDVQALIGTVDRYVRLASHVAADIGWSVHHVAAWVIVSDTGTNRRHFAQHRTVLRSALPSDGRAMRAWLVEPTTDTRAISFLTPIKSRWGARPKRD
jgi:transcriptional regulator with XRE-family HTH domain